MKSGVCAQEAQGLWQEEPRDSDTHVTCSAPDLQIPHTLPRAADLLTYKSRGTWPIHHTSKGLDVFKDPHQS